ncbi:NAD(P)/FAD-dependent oxidoreductase [Okibacterium endophyticum]
MTNDAHLSAASSSDSGAPGAPGSSTSSASSISSISSISDERWDVVIIGGGAAGLSAALILARARRRVLVLDAQEPRNRFAPHMHGVLSRDGYSPLDLVADGHREVRAVGGVIENARVTQARATADGFEIVTDSGARATARRLIVATGARDQLPDIPGLAGQWGLGVVACPYCDGYEATGRAIGVLAGSVIGLHKAHMLRSYSSDITVFTALAGPIPETDRLVLEERGMRVEDRAVTHVITDGGTITGLGLADGTVAPVDVVFAEPTPVALDEPLRQLGVEQTDTHFGLWTAVDAFGKTSVDGVWAVGNAANPAALVPIAAGSGATAALAINGELVAEDVAAASERVATASAGEASDPASDPLADNDLASVQPIGRTGD